MINKEKIINYFMALSLIIAAASGYTAIVFGENYGKKVYMLFIVTAIFLYIAYIFHKKKNYYKAKRYVGENWGKEEKRKRNLKAAKKLFSTISGNDIHISDQTWTDLNMDEVFAKVDRTYSTVGEQYLYKMLRTPLMDEKDIASRKKIINLFQTNREVREKIQVSGYNLWREKNGSDIVSFLWNDIKVNTAFKWICNILFVLNSVLIISGLLCYNGIFSKDYGSLIFFMLIITIGISVSIHTKDKGGIKAYSASASYLGALCGAVKSLTNISNDEIQSQIDIFKKNSSILNSLGKNTSAIGRTEGIDLFGDYVNILFLAEERSFFKIINVIYENKEELKKIYTAFGELEALISVASYRENINNYVEPKLTKSNKGFLDVVDLKHPLLKDPIPNSIKMENGGVIITGSNMSGKSTFLRTVGINVVFSQTICTCLATEYKSSIFRIETSINPGDNILSGKSYYLGEAEAILTIIKACDENIPMFCVIDEIFRGTNPVERISAASEIMDYLIIHNAMPIVATHDIQLTEMVKNYQLFYFSEDVNKDGLNFDYYIKKGVSPTRNAIKLLKYLGYPEDIIEKTSKKISR